MAAPAPTDGGEAEPPAVLVLDRDRIRRLLLVAVAVVVLVNLLLGGLQALTGDLSGWAAVLDVDVEQSVPTWFAAMLLAACAGAAANAGAATRRRGHADRGWTALAVVLLAASLDEAVALHERLIDPVGAALDAGGIFRHAWVVPGLVLAAVLAVAFAGFLRRQPSATRRGLLLGAVLYLAGALGMEMLGGWLLDARGAGVATGLTVVAEETLELLGAVVVLDVVLRHAVVHGAPGRAAGVVYSGDQR